MNEISRLPTMAHEHLTHEQVPVVHIGHVFTILGTSPLPALVVARRNPSNHSFGLLFSQFGRSDLYKLLPLTFLDQLHGCCKYCLRCGTAKFLFVVVVHWHMSAWGCMHLFLSCEEYFVWIHAVTSV